MDKTIFEYLLEKNYLMSESYGKVHNSQNLYHYTSPEGFLGIVRNDKIKLWFTRYDGLNDTTERKNIISSLDNYCDKQVQNNIFTTEFSELVKSVQLQDKTVLTYPTDEMLEVDNGEGIQPVTESKSIACDTYLCCFSEESDMLPMWNYYSKSQHYEGYSLGFLNYGLAQENCFKKGYRFDLKRVIYADKEKHETFDKIILPLYEIYCDGNNQIKNEVKKILNMRINDLQFIFKNNCFEHEKEIRAILKIPKKPLDKAQQFTVKYRNSNGYIVPYIEYFIDKRSLISVTTAPLINSDLAIKTIKDILKQYNYSDNVSIKPSQIPIRF